MRVYRVHLHSEGDGDRGCEWVRNKAEAESYRAQILREMPTDSYGFPMQADVEPINFTLNKSGILGVLAEFASHPDNG